MEIARSRGLDVPGDLSVVGFDNIPESVLADPSLTTIDQSIQEMGYEATLMLMRIIDDPGSGPTHVTLPTKLIVRASTSAPRKASG
jgi:LacI family transcriptional regulator